MPTLTAAEQFELQHPEDKTYAGQEGSKYPSFPISTNQPEINKSLEGTLGAASTQTTIPGLSPVTPTVPESREVIEGREDRKRQLLAAGVEERFAEEMTRTEEERKGTLGQQGAVAGAQAQGMGFSSAEVGVISMINRRYDERKSDLEKQKSEALRNLDIDTATKVDAELKRQQDRFDSQMDTVFDRFFKTKTLEMQQKTTAYNVLQDQIDIASKIPSGETMTLKDPFTGEDIIFKGLDKAEVDPFFTGANIVSLMQNIPEGQTKSITDPNTGRVYNLVGMASKDKNTRTIQSTDDKGNVTITTIDPLKQGVDAIISQVTLEGAGKSKAAPVSITIGEKQGGMLGDASATLESSKGADGYYNTDKYAEERTKFVTGGGKPELFDETFKNKLNPNDPSAKRFLTKSELDVATGGSGWTPEQEQSFLNLGIDQGLIDTAKAAGLLPADLLGQ